MIYEEVFDENGTVIPYEYQTEKIRQSIAKEIKKNKGRNLGSKSNRSSASAMEGS